jgi:c-di-GMP-binding flagellar brake protein YcgR
VDHSEAENKENAERKPAAAPSPVVIPKERRADPRLHLFNRATIRLINTASDVEGTIIDISHGGCCIQTDRRFPTGVYRRVEVTFQIDGEPFRFAGVTQAISKLSHVGIRFLDMSERKRGQLSQLIEEIKERSEPRSIPIDSER